jgi:RHS repeat-associated protein
MYSDEGLIAETDSTGTVTKTYGYRPDGTWSTNPLYLKEGATTYYLQNDHLGTSQKILSQSGQLVWSARLEAFGNTIVDPSSAITNNLRFAGQYYDSETGLHYNLNRYYDPKSGRYLTSDPIGLNGGINTYAYAQSNPLRFTDPLGLDPIQVCAAPKVPPPPFCDGLEGQAKCQCEYDLQLLQCLVNFRCILNAKRILETCILNEGTRS